jgi:hypothetical protein
MTTRILRGLLGKQIRQEVLSRYPIFVGGVSVSVSRHEPIGRYSAGEETRKATSGGAKSSSGLPS